MWTIILLILLGILIFWTILTYFKPNYKSNIRVMQRFKFISLKFTQKDVEEAKKKIFFNYPDDYRAWDPCDMPPYVENLRKQNVKNYAKYLHIQNNPKYPFKKLMKVTTISIVVSILISIIGVRTFPPTPLIGIIIIIYFSSYTYYKFKKIGKDLVKLQIAQENNWLYEPNTNYELRSGYEFRFPEIFKKGNEGRKIEDIFRGTHKKNGKLNYFVTGVFHFKKVTETPYLPIVRKYHSHFFAIKLPKKLNCRFYISSENNFSKIKNLSNKKKINIESIKFNKTFSFSYNGKKNKKALEIVKTLSPRIQEELIKISEIKKSYFNSGISILFTNNTVIFYSPGYLLPKIKTDFVFNSNKIHKKDKEQITNELNTFIDISTEIVKYLD